MFNSFIAADAVAMRPGLLSGCYPERDDQEAGWVERSAGALQGAVNNLLSERQSNLRKVAANIDVQGQSLTALSRGELDALRVDLCRQFRIQGLKTSLCIQAMALIREMSARTLEMRHYESQLMAGWVLLQGQLAEMETGEGKTLAATLAAATAALAGIPVHVITVNEYLVERDARAMGPLYRALGLSVGFVTQEMEHEQRRAAYASDITYCTNKQVTFDYLRDRLLLGNNRSQLRLRLESAYNAKNRKGQFLLRGLCFGIVDEADSVLIDEARTPLIITRTVDSTTEHDAYRKALKMAEGLTLGRDFFLDTSQRSVQLSLTGQKKLAGLKLPSDGLWQNPRHREALICQALHALHLLHKDRDYLVEDEKVLIIDANTGRTMPDRSWERGLHQMVETKEDCPLTDAREQLGRLTYQRFFRRYLRLGGMTGTAREVRSELWSVYGLRVQRIPLHRPSQRKQWKTRIFPQLEQKWKGVTEAVKTLGSQGRPVLIGTGSVAESEVLSRKLTAAGIGHRVLNARQDKEEADIVAEAGKKNQVTVATNMAGRGTDIPLEKGVAELGGLHVIATCRNEAQRIDRQLYGRCARQGDPGSYQVMLSLEDELLQQNGDSTLAKLLKPFTGKKSNWRHKMDLYAIRRAQKHVERRHREARRALLQHDKQTGRMLSFSGNLE